MSDTFDKLLRFQPDFASSQRFLKLYLYSALGVSAFPMPGKLPTDMSNSSPRMDEFRPRSLIMEDSIMKRFNHLGDTTECRST